MRKLREGICGLHTRGRFLVTKVVRASYYWPALRADALDFTKRCKRCQEFADIPCIPPNNLHSLSYPWPFAMWGMNILGPLPKALGAVKYSLVAIDYFTIRIPHDTKKHYQMIEKVTLALITSARRLRPYFQSHQVVVKMNYLVK